MSQLGVPLSFDLSDALAGEASALGTPADLLPASLLEWLLGPRRKKKEEEEEDK